MRTELTDQSVAALKPSDYRYDVCDIANRGFLVRVYPSGAKAWHYRYRIRDTLRMMHLASIST